ncbi:arsenate-mycothiol transferase ArsC [Halorubrum depositum]|uniref:arsenate-mycothiol transferase ArsC n=1 Tax=Halorubrum depositum TaxID=2583992 RepID=UPI00119EC434|nr:low molecular weight phosphatase family protein [Halorubrum depositum]
MSQHNGQPDRRVAFVCVQNAGRSQMAAAFAERERDRREAGDRIGIVTGGTRPADRVHDVVVEAMGERDMDLGDRTPREVTPEELGAVDLVVTMGCSASDVCPATWNGENRDWGLDDPHERPIEEVREIRDEIERRVVALFDELLSETASAG